MGCFERVHDQDGLAEPGWELYRSFLGLMPTLGALALVRYAEAMASAASAL